MPSVLEVQRKQSGPRVSHRYLILPEGDSFAAILTNTAALYFSEVPQ
jgi:hypothetical protein